MDIKDKLLSCRGTNISWAPAVQMDLKGVVDLLERRWSIYSGRPHFAMVGELYVSYWLVSVPYCRWRFNRFLAIASDGLSPRFRALQLSNSWKNYLINPKILFLITDGRHVGPFLRILPCQRVNRITVNLIILTSCTLPIYISLSHLTRFLS